MANEPDDIPVLLSTDAARGGVTGHHVRYVLAFGLAGAVVAFLVLGAYLGFGSLTLAKLHELSGRQVMIGVGAVVIGALSAGLLFGLWRSLAGPSEDASQNIMRWRVILQFVVIALVMGALYFSTR